VEYQKYDILENNKTNTDTDDIEYIGEVVNSRGTSSRSIGVIVVDEESGNTKLVNSDKATNTSFDNSMSSSRSSRAIKNTLESMIKCPVCLDSYYEILSKQSYLLALSLCGHLICNNCAVSLVKGVRRLVQCPTCRKKMHN
ncbi:MAG: E3 ubiquitin-protein ligase rnf4, partial [Paramarteilia canceri]